MGFKSFCEKTPITFSGTGITCIVGPNGCGKSNVVDAISWVLGEQSKKMLRAEAMSDCIFNGTAKRPPMGLSEVTLTLVDPDLVDAMRKIAAAPVAVETEVTVVDIPAAPLADAEIDAEPAEPVIVDPTTRITGEVTTSIEEGFVVVTSTQEYSTDVTEPGTSAPSAAEAEPMATEAVVEDPSFTSKFKKKRAAEKHAPSMKPGEVVVGRRLYRSGQSEYVINGRVARLRDVQELFSGLGLGPDSYAIIEQGRIGQILNSKPMDRRAIIEEAAGITMYKTKRRLAEAKLEASKINLSRVHDILVEVEKQLASLKRQASKARRYAELREQMRGSATDRAGEQSAASGHRGGAAGVVAARDGCRRVARSNCGARTRGRTGAAEPPELRTRRRAAADAEPAQPGGAGPGSCGEPHHVQP